MSVLTILQQNTLQMAVEAYSKKLKRMKDSKNLGITISLDCSQQEIKLVLNELLQRKAKQQILK